jgi:predicted metal-dependent phosphoesterase TrpH
VVRAAAKAGVELLALTDHDTVSGGAEALEAAESAPLRLVPAAELSALHGDYEDFHVCAYEIDHAAPELEAALEDFRADRDVRAHKMANKLGDLGFAIDDELLDERRRSGYPIGRPHLAQAVLADVNNEKRLDREGIDDVGGLIERYLVPGAPAYLPRSRPTVAEAIALIHDAGGLAVWAHPFWDLSEIPEVRRTLTAFADAGLDGVEAFYPQHTEAQVKALVEAADAMDLLTTGSSDFHGPEHRLFNRFRAFDLHGFEPRLGRMSY